MFILGLGSWHGLRALLLRAECVFSARQLEQSQGQRRERYEMMPVGGAVVGQVRQVRRQFASSPHQ